MMASAAVLLGVESAHVVIGQVFERPRIAHVVFRERCAPIEAKGDVDPTKGEERLGDGDGGASCVLLIPFAASQRRFVLAGVLIGAVAVESLVLVLNSWRCPLTDVAARYTADRRPNFDIYLPTWLARYNKQIFGSLYAGGIVWTLVAWFAARTN